MIEVSEEVYGAVDERGIPYDMKFADEGTEEFDLGGSGLDILPSPTLR